LDAWLHRHQQPLGFVASVQAFYDLSVDWYSGRMDESWERPTPDQAVAIFARHGFTGDFWRLD
jgi:hypothetical protein